MAKLSPEDQAKELLSKLDLLKKPVPLEPVAKALGAQIRYEPLAQELSGMVFIKDGTPIIGVNALHHPNRQRFTIAHELGHLVMHRKMLTEEVHVDTHLNIRALNRDDASTKGTEQLEIEANQFAAALLMPEALLKKAFDEPFDIDDDAPLEKVAKSFRVSKQALEFRIRNRT